MNREWMYRRFTSDGCISPEFQQGLESFIQFACGQPAYMDGDKIRCPCRKCKNLSYRDVDTVKLHISSKGFVFNYHVWSAQGERRIRNERPNLAGISSSALVVVSEPDGRGKRFDRHRGGSRSAVAYSYHMVLISSSYFFYFLLLIIYHLVLMMEARDQGVPIKDTIYPTFKKLHYNERYDNYIGGKAIRIVDEVEAQVADLSQSLSLPEGVSPTRADSSGIFIGVAQHPVKNRVVSVGSLYSVPSVCSRWEGGGSGMTSTKSDSALHAELDELRTKLEASQKAREEMERRQDNFAKEQQRMREMFEQQKEVYKQMREMLEQQQQEVYKQQQPMLEQIMRYRDTPSDDM